MANTPPLKLTRNQLAAFLKDHESIKAFENLFRLTENIAPDTVQDALVAAESAGASALQAQALALQAANDALSTAAVAEARASMALQTAHDARTMAELAATDPALNVSPEFQVCYGQFFDTTTQVAAAANTAYQVTYNASDVSDGVKLQPLSTSRITVSKSGVYNVQFSVQLDKTSGGTARFWIWFRRNGVDIPNSASELHIQGNNHEVFSAANLFVSLNAGDYVELVWATSDTSVQLTSRIAATPVPSVPSVIVTVSSVRTKNALVVGVGDSDPFFISVTLLLHLNGANGSTSFVDSSLRAAVVSRFGDAVISTAQSRFGGSSLLLDGVDDHLRVANSAELLNPAQNYTVEGYFYTSSSQEQMLFSTFNEASSNGFRLAKTATNAIQLQIYNSSLSLATSITGANNSFPLNQWAHVALVRFGSVYRVFIDGVTQINTTNSAHAIGDAQLSIGRTDRAAGQLFWNGYIDEVRITNSEARYTADFTPPTAPFPDS